MLDNTRLTSSKTAVAHASRIPASDESGELLRLAVRVGGIGIFETDLERGRTRFSPELCAILGLPAQVRRWTTPTLRKSWTDAIA